MKIVTDPVFTAYCRECEETTPMENVASVVKCVECGHLVIGEEVV